MPASLSLPPLPLFTPDHTARNLLASAATALGLLTGSIPQAQQSTPPLAWGLNHNSRGPFNPATRYP